MIEFSGKEFMVVAIFPDGSGKNESEAPESG
jgi:hypothetical protein